MSMTIGEVLTALATFDSGAQVIFDFCGCYPSGVGSWRGRYDEPSIQWDHERGHYPTVEAVVAMVKTLIDGRSFGGWKGGDFYYTEAHTLHVDQAGCCTSTEIRKIKFIEGYVTICTKREDT